MVKRDFEGQGVAKAGNGDDGGEVYNGGEACDDGKGVGISGVVVSIRPAYSMPTWNAAVDAILLRRAQVTLN